jgi:ParB-like chromosome segregation protein Spo0J
MDTPESCNGKSALGNTQGLLATCRVDKLHPHPTYSRHHLSVAPAKVSALAERGDLAFQEPLIVTRDRTIIDGYARWELARLQGRLTLPCIAYDLTDAEALCWLLQRHCHSYGLNDFVRILLALELEPVLTERARSNQSVGGQNKGSSRLTEADRRDVRSEIAAAAGVSAGNVTKVKQLMTTAGRELIKALRNGEISIHRAWLWGKASPEEQQELLWRYDSERGIRKKIRQLISGHVPKELPTVPELSDLCEQLSRIEPDQLSPVRIAVIDVPGKGLFLTKELFQVLEAQEELSFTCATNSH